MKRTVTIIAGVLLIAVSSVWTVNSLAAKSHHHAHHHAAPVAATSTLNINSASADQLATLKGLGQKKAAAIVAYRKQSGPFSTLDDLAKVKGIGKKSVTRLLKSNPGRLVIE